MSQFLLRFLKGGLSLALILALLWGLNQFKIIDSKGLILQAASLFPGLNRLPQTYALGQKRNLQLSAKDKKLRALQAKLAAENNALQNAKLQLQKQQSKAVASPTPPPNQSQYVNMPTVLKFPPPTSAEKLNSYLNTIGNMQPAEAAAVIQKLPEQTVYLIFDQLRPYRVSRIMEKLPAAYLATLSQDRLNKYRNL